MGPLKNPFLEIYGLFKQASPHNIWKYIYISLHNITKATEEQRGTETNQL